jgi:hypothetical protein
VVTAIAERNPIGSRGVRKVVSDSGLYGFQQVSDVLWGIKGSVSALAAYHRVIL